ncbi:CPBP family intramembrane glutamic endopeptidase [Halocatena salina]|uniref:CPBP family intramembrane metalloprotease n=1 Tax=Halocatena salina TaxID=2934340 RepID=A0A8U0A0T7_9EURY|nr:type II CAAX endopeptidase family protein [Halocatena salina]UPM42409.1 CPBP family intramembrane metalloprotease [Halocatena salina]
MTDWTAFAGIVGVVLALLLVLARLSQDAVSGFVDDRSPHSDYNAEPTNHSTEQDQDTTPTPERRPSPTERLSPVTVLLNVGLSQGLFGVLLLAGVWFTSVPMAALGVDTADPKSFGGVAFGVGIITGIGLYAINALGAACATALDHEYDHRLREHLTPETTTGWLILLGGVLPIIAGFEELLFRGALIGALSTGFSISPWLLAVGSSIAFAVGHGAQGRIGVLVTGVLGFGLAGIFVLTNSLLVVIIAHYLINALEFLISGMLDIEWG